MENIEKPKQNREIRVVGNASEEAKDRTKEEYRKKLFEHFASLSESLKEEAKKYERPKTEEELEMISLADKQTSYLMTSLGIESFSVPPENIHLIPKSYQEFTGKGGDALTDYHKQGILVDDKYTKDNPIYFTSAVFHEILHLKAHVSIELEEQSNKSLDKSLYRTGVETISSQKKKKESGHHSHFLGLHEAIVALAQQNFTKSILENPEGFFKEDIEWMKSPEAFEIKKEFMNRFNIQDINEVNLSLLNKTKEFVPLLNVESRQISASTSIYYEQKKVLKYILSEIQKQFPEKYNSSDGVFKDFLRAHFTGQILPIARLIEKTFGDGSFRSLGEMDTSIGSARMKLETFKKLRSKILREKEVASLK